MSSRIANPINALQVMRSCAKLASSSTFGFHRQLLRILIANYEFPPVGGGASKVSFNLARTLVGRGHEVHVLTSRYGDLPGLETIDGVRIHRVWSWRNGIHDSGLRGAFTYLLAALPRLRKILSSDRIDVVHFFFGLPTGLLSLYSHSIRHTPYIVSLRGSDVPLYDQDSRKLLFLHKLTKPLSHRIWRHASGVFAVSRGLREMAEESFPDVDVDVIYNGVDVDVDVVDEARVGDKHRIGEPLRIICVSRLIPRKGISDLLEALATLPELDYQLTVIGAGPSDFSLRNLAVQRSIANKVRFFGYRPASELTNHYISSDICVLPTRSDAFANVILEAMAAALPVVATKVGGVAEAVIDGETGILVDASAPDQLAEAVQALARDPALRRRLGRAGQQRVRDKFTWAENARRHVVAYEQACNEG